MKYAEFFKAIGNAIKIGNLDLSNKKLTLDDINEHFKNFQAIENAIESGDLDLSNQNLTSADINEHFKSFEEIQTMESENLDLSNQNLTLSALIIEKIKKVDLSQNYLTDIPKQVYFLKNCVELNIVMNPIMEIDPLEIAKMHNIKTIRAVFYGPRNEKDLELLWRCQRYNVELQNSSFFVASSPGLKYQLLRDKALSEGNRFLRVHPELCGHVKAMHHKAMLKMQIEGFNISVNPIISEEFINAVNAMDTITSNEEYDHWLEVEEQLKLGDRVPKRMRTGPR